MFRNLSRLFQSSLLFFIAGCGNSLNCALNEDNITGRFSFADNISIVSNADIRAEWSIDNFTTVSGGKSFNNLHGLPTFKYSLCADDGTVQIRVFQDSNRSGTLDTGEKVGRYDGTSNGDAAYLSKTITFSTTKIILDGIDVTIDSTK